MTTNDAHHAEYLAAAAGLCEQTPPPRARVTYADGDFISGITCGKRWSGRVEWIDQTHATIDVGGGWLRVPLADVTH